MVDLRQIAVAVAVAILSAVFVGLLIDLVYDEPDYNDFCKFDYRSEPVIKGEVRCDYTYGEGYQKCIEEEKTPRFKYNESGCPVFESCDPCSKNFEDARKLYTRNIFIITAVIGIIAIFVGTLWKIEFLGTGIMFGGILLLIYGTARFFGDADKLLRVIIVFAELLIVIWIGYKKLYRRDKTNKKIGER